MNRFNPWAFAIIFLCVAAYILWNDVNVGMLFSFKNAETKAYVTKVFTRYEKRSGGYVLHIEYVFVADSTLYKGVKVAKGREVIGNTLQLRYSANNPVDNEILKSNFEFGEGKKKAFLNTRLNGYGSIEIVNGIYFHKEQEKGELLLDEIGTYVQRQDTLIFTRFLKERITKWIRNEKGEILDVESGLVYK